MHALLAYITAHATEDRPALPGTWDFTIEGDRWTSIWPLGRTARPEVYFHARLIMRHPSFPQRALFICTRGAAQGDTATPAQIIQRLADLITADALPWTKVWTTFTQFMADVTTIAQQIRANWPDERPRDENGNPVGTILRHLKRMAGFLAEDAES